MPSWGCTDYCRLLSQLLHPRGASGKDQPSLQARSAGPGPRSEAQLELRSMTISPPSLTRRSRIRPRLQASSVVLNRLLRSYSDSIKSFHLPQDRLAQQRDTDTTGFARCRRFLRTRRRDAPPAGDMVILFPWIVALRSARRRIFQSECQRRATISERRPIFRPSIP